MSTEWKSIVSSGASFGTILVFIALWLPASTKCDALIERIYAGDHRGSTMFVGNGFVFEKSELHYVITAYHAVCHERTDSVLNFAFLGQRDCRPNEIQYLWGDSVLDIVILEKTYPNSGWVGIDKGKRELPLADSPRIDSLAARGADGEIRFLREGADLDTVPIRLLPHEIDRDGRLSVEVTDTSEHGIKCGMSGALIFTESELLGVLSKFDAATNRATATRWDTARTEILHNLNSDPYQICMTKWVNKKKRNRRWKTWTTGLAGAFSVAALWCHLEADSRYGEYEEAVDRRAIEKAWNRYEDMCDWRRAALLSTGAFVALDIWWFLRAPRKPTIDGDCVAEESRRSSLSLRVNPAGVTLSYAW